MATARMIWMKAMVTLMIGPVESIAEHPARQRRHFGKSDDVEQTVPWPVTASVRSYPAT